MSMLKNRAALKFGTTGIINDKLYQTYDFAWPVEVVECYANKVSPRNLDVLAESVLELLSIPEMSVKKISDLLNISEVITAKIITQKLYPQGFVKGNEISEKGKEYIKNGEMDVFQSEKTFGNMFVSLIDNEVFPYFYEGKLPNAYFESDIYYFSYHEAKDRHENNNIQNINFQDKLNRGFSKYGKIHQTSEESNNKAPDFYVEDEFEEYSYNDVVDETDSVGYLFSEKTSNESKNKSVKLLKTDHRQIYIKFRICLSQANPELFEVVSPFSDNKTNWYTKCFQRMRENGEFICLAEDEGNISINDFCDGETKKLIIEFPELLEHDFSYFIKTQFPKMNESKLYKICEKKYREIYKLTIHYSHGEIEKHILVTEQCKAIELLLNNYLNEIDKQLLIKRYRAEMLTEKDVRDIFRAFDIYNCNAQTSAICEIEHNYSKKMINSFYQYNGKSVHEKYFFLTVDAYFNNGSAFGSALKNEGESLVNALDYINLMRNKFGAHSDGDAISEMSEEMFEKYRDAFTYVTNVLIYSYKGGQTNGKTK